MRDLLPLLVTEHEDRFSKDISMPDNQQPLKQWINDLRQQRDELSLQMHLAKAEAKEEWGKVTAKLDQLSKDHEPLKDAVEETAGNVFAALKLVAGEVQEGFRRIRKSL
jgi:DNA-binding SARP family transcriptional activator